MFTFGQTIWWVAMEKHTKLKKKIIMELGHLEGV
jgi:hypothetical protein